MQGVEYARISEYLFRHAELFPDKEFLVSADRRLTYRQAAAEVTAISRALLASGVGPGSRVATLANPSPEFALTFLATVDIGAVWVGLNPKYTRRELSHVVGNSRPLVVFGVTDHRGPTDAADLFSMFGANVDARVVTLGGDVPDAALGAINFQDFLSGGAATSDDELAQARGSVEPRQAALIVYTSGTTGAPKGAVLSHYSLSWSFHRQGQRWGGSSMRVICNMPINHVGCVGDIFSSALTVGGTVVLMERFDPAGMLETISQERVNTLMQIPTMYQMLAASPGFDDADLTSLRQIRWGGAAMPAPVLAKLVGPGRSLGVVYGQSEAPASITFSGPDATLEQLATTMGCPDPDMEVRLVDEHGDPCAPGVAGEIQVRHPSLFLEYFENPEATGAAFTEDGFLHTGDLALVRPDGHWQMVGRLKEMFKSGGYNVYPREIELCLESHPDLEMAIVVSRPDEIYDEVGHAFVVPNQGAALDEQALRVWCQERLANYKVPKGITLADSVPMLPIGKPDRQALRSTAIQLQKSNHTSRRMENV